MRGKNADKRCLHRGDKAFLRKNLPVAQVLDKLKDGSNGTAGPSSECANALANASGQPPV